MVFLIQNIQNRDAKSANLKLDEVIRAVKGARNELVNLQELSDDDLKKLEQQFTRVRERAEQEVEHGHDASAGAESDSRALVAAFSAAKRYAAFSAAAQKRSQSISYVPAAASFSKVRFVTKESRVELSQAVSHYLGCDSASET